MSAKTVPQAVRTVRRRSIRTTLFLETFLLLTLTVVTIAVAAFFLSLGELKNRTVSQLQSIAEGKEVLLETTVSRQREQLSVLAHDPGLGSLPSITDLVGFRQLVRIDESGMPTVLVGNSVIDPVTTSVLQSIRNHEGTVFRPVITDEGWTMYVIAAPQTIGAIRGGTLAAVFDADGLARQVLQADSAGATAEVLLVTHAGDEDILLRTDETTNRIVPVRGSTEDFLSVVQRALAGEEGIIETSDYAGIPVLAAYRSVPTLGWAVIAKIDDYEVRGPIEAVAINLGGAGFVLVILLSLSAFFLAQRIVGPLEELVGKLDGLESKHWNFARSIFTGNELETVDNAADDLTRRLRRAHEHLEDIVKKRTKALQSEHAEDAAILQSMDDGLIVTDAAGMITYMNHQADMLTGWSKASGKPVTEVLVISDKDGMILKMNNHPVTTVLRTQTPFRPTSDPQFTLRKRDNTQTALQVRVTPILRKNECIGSVAVLRDITEERKIDHMKSEFISLVSHQLRTPLASMRWYLEMLINGDAGGLSDDQREYVGQAAVSNARMVHLVSALLNVSRIELGKFQLSPETIEVSKLVSNASTNFDLELQQKNIHLKLEIPAKDIGIRSDKGLLELILENMVSNAIKYSHPDSAVTISVTEDRTTGTATLSVVDTGIGIPEVQRELIGRKLFRGSNAKVSDTDGNGLGLYISLLAAETIGAKLTFESAEGKGTTFKLVIPLDPKKI